MYGPLVRSLIEQHHEGALQAARTQRLAKQARHTIRPRPERAGANLSWASVVSLLRGTALS